jgi:hypothetical protein
MDRVVTCLCFLYAAYVSFSPLLSSCDFQVFLSVVFGIGPCWTPAWIVHFVFILYKSHRGSTLMLCPVENFSSQFLCHPLFAVVFYILNNKYWLVVYPKSFASTSRYIRTTRDFALYLWSFKEFSFQNIIRFIFVS